MVWIRARKREGSFFTLKKGLARFAAENETERQEREERDQVANTGKPGRQRHEVRYQGFERGKSAGGSGGAPATHRRGEAAGEEKVSARTKRERERERERRAPSPLPRASHFFRAQVPHLTPFSFPLQAPRSAVEQRGARTTRTSRPPWSTNVTTTTSGRQSTKSRG